MITLPDNMSKLGLQIFCHPIDFSVNSALNHSIDIIVQSKSQVKQHSTDMIQELGNINIYSK